MVASVAAPQARGKFSVDKILGANQRANKLIDRLGPEAVINGTVGAIMDEDGRLVMLNVVKEAFASLSAREMIAYAPIQGYGDYLDDVIAQCFSQSRPDGYIRACATSGGSGVIHHVVHNYSEPGDTVLTSDWHWGNYDSICKDNGRKIREFELFDKTGAFNFSDFKTKVSETAAVQYNTVILLNSPANNPTGFALSPEDWDNVLAFLQEVTAGQDKNIILVPDVAYLDYSGEKEECRRFFKKFGNLPSNIFVIVAYTLSKGFTMYGQRMGAMIGISSDKDVIDEFVAVNQYTNRATWSNSNSAAMKAMVHICGDSARIKKLDAERSQYYALIQERAELFMKEADACGLTYLPYLSGFFMTLPVSAPQQVVDDLERKHIFLVPLGKGIRLAVCSLPKNKLRGLAAEIKKSVDACGITQ